MIGQTSLVFWKSTSVLRCSINKLKKRMLIHTLLRRCCLYELGDSETGSAVVVSKLRYVKMIERIGQVLRRIFPSRRTDYFNLLACPSFFWKWHQLHDLVATKVACITRTPYNDKQYKKYND
jgi:hypothetical protein